MAIFFNSGSGPELLYQERTVLAAAAALLPVNRRWRARRGELAGSRLAQLRLPSHHPPRRHHQEGAGIIFPGKPPPPQEKIITGVKWPASGNKGGITHLIVTNVFCFRIF